MPIYSRPGPGAGFLGYTKNLVAFAGMQQGGQIMIITYSGLDGRINGTITYWNDKMRERWNNGTMKRWNDGTTIAPLLGAPGQRCIVPGRDLLQRPIFEID